jgi:hypothetical protein
MNSTNLAEMDERIRARFRDLESAVLLELWQKDERLPPAEAALRSELLERGESAERLDAIAADREALARSRGPSERETILEYGLLARFATMVLVLGLGTMLSNLFGGRVAMVAVGAILLAYVGLSTRRILQQYKAGTSQAGGLLMAYQLVEGIGLGAVGLVLLVAAVRIPQ